MAHLSTFINEAKTTALEEHEKTDLKQQLAAFLRTGQMPLALSYVCIAAKPASVRY